MSETNKDIAVAFYKAVIEGRVEDAFRRYAVPTYRQHNPLIEDGMEGPEEDRCLAHGCSLRDQACLC
jgi:predicted SnoaL-like aldol condensation-catalyzing enzyme